jgi:hypothetical protein
VQGDSVSGGCHVVSRRIGVGCRYPEVYDEDVSSPSLRALRDADRASLFRNRGFESWEAFWAWVKDFQARHTSK